jgi:pimeloyl-ACP methyl ester carboxylesterase
MPFLDLDGLRIHYQQKGQGEDIVLIHAITGNMAVWLFGSIMDALATEFRVTAYDLRGHGASGVPDSGYTSADMANDLCDIAGALKLGPALLIGHSFGAVVALHAAVLYPDMVRGLILSDAFFPGLAHLEPNLAEAEIWRQLRDALRAAGIAFDAEVDFTSLFRAAAEVTPAQAEHLRDAMGASWMRWLSQLSRLAPTTCGKDMFAPAGLTAERICAVRRPVIALYDEHTSFAATCGFLRANLPEARVEIVPGAKHLAPLESPEAFIGLVQKHARLLAGGAEREACSSTGTGSSIF